MPTLFRESRILGIPTSLLVIFGILIPGWVMLIWTNASNEELASPTSHTTAHRNAQEARDEEARVYSYWPSTLRVDADMDSFWLNHEERICQTHPDEHGRIGVVSCDPTRDHQEHNIPVRFWGGVERNIVSDWKCRREGDDFVCRAID